MTHRLIVEETGGAVRVLLHRAGQLIAEPAGPAQPFTSPLSASEREDLRWYLEDYLLSPYAVYEERGAQIAGLLSAWGERLFDSLFGPGTPGRDAYLLARQAPCEILLASASADFHSLPWELLRDPRQSNPLALDVAGLDRTLPVGRDAAVQGSGAGRLRVLLVIARPAGRLDVAYRAIGRPLLDRLAPVAGEVDLEVLRPPTFEALKARLAEARDRGEPFQILHFDGHGAFGPPLSAAAAGRHRFAAAAPQGYFLFETATGGEEPVAAADLAPVVSGAEVPLIVFNACRSGMQSAAGAAESAVATGLLAGGAAAVVAMSHSVYAVAAAEFMAAFYDALFAGETVAQATGAGRRQLRRNALRPSPRGFLPLTDWIVPVHYARREVSFPGLRRTSAPLSLPAALDRLRAARPPAPPVAGLHLPGDLAATGDFLGRDTEIQELEGALRHRRVALVHGLGGTGKTELAKGFARWLRDTGGLDGPDAVFFHSFEPGLATFGLPGVVAAIGRGLYGPDFARLDPPERRAAVAAALREHRILLVWDNFETVHSLPDPARATPPLDDAEREDLRSFVADLARHGRGGLVLTSRSPEPWLGGDEIHRLELGGLAREDAYELADRLLAGLPRATERRNHRAFPELLEQLDGHPLSLRLVLPRLEETAAAELLAALRGERLLPAGPGEAQGRLGSLGACVEYSFRQLPATDQDRLPVLALFVAVADVDVLALLSREESAPARFAGIDRDTWATTLDRCGRAGLLTALGAGCYRIHPALPAYLLALWRQRAGDGSAAELAAARAAAVAAHAAFGSWLKDQLDGGRADLAMRLLELEGRSLGAAAQQALAARNFAAAQAILQPLDDFWDSRGWFEEARAWVDRCREQTEQRGIPPAMDTPAGDLWSFMVSSQANRTLAAGRLDEAEAEYHHLRQLREASLETGSPSIRGGLRVAYHQLGLVAQRRGDLPAAEAWYRKALEINEDLGNRPGLASSYHELGRVAQHRGDLPAAEAWYRKSLEINEDLGNRPGLASSYHELGRVAQHRGDLPAAEAWYQKALEIKEDLGNRPGLASSYHELGRVAQHRGDLPAAEAWYRKALEIKEDLGNRPGLASTYHQLGLVAENHGDLPAAEAWYRKSLEIEEDLGNRPGLASSYGQLGLLAEARGDKTGALEHTVRCVAQFDDFPHPSTGPGPRHLARLAAELGPDALAAAWLRVTGQPLPAAIRRVLALPASPLPEPTQEP